MASGRSHFRFTILAEDQGWEGLAGDQGWEWLAGDQGWECLAVYPGRKNVAEDPRRKNVAEDPGRTTLAADRGRFRLDARIAERVRFLRLRLLRLVILARDPAEADSVLGDNPTPRGALDNSLANRVDA
jgi:hypothetical protein